MASILDLLREEYAGLNEQRQSVGMEQRGVLAAMHDKLTNSELAKMSPAKAGFFGAAANFLGDKGSIGGYMEGRQRQEAIRDKAALGAMPEMNQFLSESGKQMTDLQQSVIKRLNDRETDASNRFYVAGTAADGLILVDKATGKTSLQTIPSRFSAQMADSEQKWVDILSKEGGDPAVIQKEANSRAMQEIASMMGLHQFGDLKQQNFQSPVGINTAQSPQTGLPTAAPENTGLPIPGDAPAIPAGAPQTREPLKIQSRSDAEIALSEGRITPQEFEAIGLEFKKAGVPFEGDKFIQAGVPGAAPVAASQMKIRSPQQRATETELGQLHAKENASDRESLAGMQGLERSRAVMADIINSGSHTSSPMHELLSDAGGFLSLIDPNNSLSKAAGNDQMYYANLMNLVRDKIKALGAGTAVSNLDLIVTQKSVGDLRNTAEGNKKLLAAMELQNATMMAKLGGKLKYFDQAKSYDGYRGDSSSTHILRRSPKTGEYWVQSREDWINEQLKAGVVKTPEDADRFFEQEARTATKRMIKGTSLDPDYYKKK